MANYCTTAEVKAYIVTNGSGDDTMIAALIARASALIDAFCGRTFVQRTAETRTFDAVRDVDGVLLYVDDDLLAVTSITNGDSTSVTASEYVLLPANTAPKYAIKLKSSSSTSWTYSTDPEDAISVTGTWGYVASATAPSAINHAAIRLTAWLYHQRQAPFETVAFPDVGAVTVPTAMPPDIAADLDLFTRHTIGARR